jgi:hypothetical protein
VRRVQRAGSGRTLTAGRPRCPDVARHTRCAGRLRLWAAPPEEYLATPRSTTFMSSSRRESRRGQDGSGENNAEEDAGPFGLVNSVFVATLPPPRQAALPHVRTSWPRGPVPLVNDRDHDAGVSGAAAATRGATMGLHAGSGPRCLHSHRTTGAHRQPGLMGRHARRCACRTRTLHFRASAHLGAARQRRFLRPRLTPVCPRSACGWHRSDAAGRLSLASAAHGCEPPLAPFCCLLL